METLGLKHIEKAAARLRGVIHETPLVSSTFFSRQSGGDVYLKYENLQKTGSFKIRGAYNKISECKQTGHSGPIFAASAGNHAQGVAYAASKLGFTSTIVMPKYTTLAKAAATEGYGAQVCLHGANYDSAYEKAMEICRQEQGVFIHAFDDPAVIAGQGTLGIELLQALPGVDVIVIPAGGGGLLSGVAFTVKAINPRVRIVGVQAAGANAIYRSFHEKTPVSTPSVSTIADGIAVGKPGDLTRELINQYADDMVTVSDPEISSAILLLLERSKQVVEPAGAASLAAVLSGKLDVKDKRVACVLSGGNVDVSMISKIIEIGLTARGLKIKFRTVMPDIPGSLERLARVLSEAEANIVAVQYDRMSADLSPNELVAHIACEVRGGEHGQAVLQSLHQAGYHVITE